MEVKATARKLNITPRKARLIVDLVRNRNTTDALAILKNCTKMGAYDVYKLINSAISNAVNNNALKADSLFIKSIIVNDGPTLKRIHARAKGRAASILKRSSHITVTLADVSPAKTPNKPNAKVKG